MQAAHPLRVGDFLVDLTCRKVRPCGDGPTGKLTVKALQVLLVLVEANGEVVTREALFARVWPDTMPTDDVLTQAVAQLRRTFGDDRDAPRYIETIAKVGYRLVATFDREPERAHTAADASDAQEGADEATPAVDAQRRGSLPVVVALAALALAALVAWAMVGREEPVTPTTSATSAPAAAVAYKAMTSMPGQERWPMLSPDGRTVAFAQMDEGGGKQTAILLQDTGQAVSRPLTTPPAGSSDQLPVWSRDGRKIAFVRTSADDCRIMVVAASGGDPAEAGACHLGSYSLFDWTPDGRGLVMGGFSDARDAGSPLRLLDLATGQWRALAYDIAVEDVDSLPRYSPDGKWLAFRRNLSFSDIWLMPAEGGSPRRITDVHGDIRGWDWLPDGSGMVFSWIGPQPGLYRYDMSDRVLTALPPLPAGRPVFPDIAADDWSMVFEIDQSRSGMFRLPIDGTALPPTRGQLFESSGTDLLPSISPDGTTLAFLSDRAIALQLWVGEIAHPQTLRAIDGITPIPRHAPVWAPDGRSLLVIARTAEGDRLFEVDVGGDRARRLPVPGGTPFHATYTGSPDRLLVGVDTGDGRLQLVLYALPHWQALASIDDVAVARYDETGDQVYFTRAGRSGLWRANAQLGDVAQVTDALPHPAHYRKWVVLDGTPTYSGPASHCRVSWLPITGGAGSCLMTDPGTSTGAPTVPRDGGALYLALPVAQNIDVGWTDLLAAPGVTAADVVETD